jgi:hypothetical protein
VRAALWIALVSGLLVFLGLASGIYATDRDASAVDERLGRALLELVSVPITALVTGCSGALVAAAGLRRARAR